MASKSWEDKIAELETRLSECSKKVKCADAPCMSPQVIICLVAPILIFLALYFLKPSFVQRSDGGKAQRNTKKVFLFTLLFTAIIWGLVYCYNRATGSSMY